MSVPAGIVIGAACFVSYVLAYPGTGDQTALARAGTSALITLIAMALWVLGIVARPYTWWKAGLLAVMTAASVLMFVLPLPQRLFLLDPSDTRDTLTALAIAAIGIVLLEGAWSLARRIGGSAEQDEVVS